ncbi:ABC transporter permease subunit [Nakamurella aerolata]|uniref:ABC transporter permease subunit n=1 Tax=Nakamurella aerolata TaxID=1656892 RepID=A0A849A7X1_9ACTN|nr:ABC transporter permease subunit [Nakamurella aerolata]
MNWQWLSDNSADIRSWFLAHLYLAGVSTVLGLVLSLPLGMIAYRFRWTYPPLINLAGILYTIPSIALFVLLPGLIGTSFLSPLNVIIALTLYTLALLVRVVADALRAVPEDVRLSAQAMGYRPLASLLRVQLPMAIPVIGAGLRVAAVSNVSLVAVGTLIGVQQLGQLFTRGLALSNYGAFYTPIWAGIVLSIVIAVAFDLLILLGIRLASPWQRVSR